MICIFNMPAYKQYIYKDRLRYPPKRFEAIETDKYFHITAVCPFEDIFWCKTTDMYIMDE